jgi:hypothetical protein
MLLDERFISSLVRMGFMVVNNNISFPQIEKVLGIYPQMACRFFLGLSYHHIFIPPLMRKKASEREREREREREEQCST